MIGSRSRRSRLTLLDGLQFVAIAWAFFVPQAGRAEETIDDAMDWSLRGSFSIKADIARQESLDARVLGAYEAFLPTVTWTHSRNLHSRISYSPDYTWLTSSYYGVDISTRNEPTLYGLQLSMPLFDGFKRYNELLAAQDERDAGLHLQSDKKQSVSLEATDAYLATIRDREILSLRRRLISDISGIAERVKAQLSVHDTTLADSALADSRVSVAKASYEQAQSELAASEIELARLTRSKVEELARPAAPKHDIPATLDELDQLVAKDNPKLRAARLHASAAKHEADSAYSQFLPTADLLVSRTDETNLNSVQSRLRDTTVKLLFKVPLYQPGSFSTVGRMNATARQKYYESLDLERSAIASARTLFVARLSTIRQIAQMARRIADLEKAVAAQKVELSAGLRTIVDVLNIRSELTEARVAKAAMEFQRERLAFALAAAVGRLAPPMSAASADR
ncbi:MAG TPA: TolC family protein [Methylosinus sp.]|jgi:outer membrane protein TolC